MELRYTLLYIKLLKITYLCCRPQCLQTTNIFRMYQCGGSEICVLDGCNVFVFPLDRQLLGIWSYGLIHCLELMQTLINLYFNVYFNFFPSNKYLSQNNQYNVADTEK